jgi:hypothetical protein
VFVINASQKEKGRAQRRFTSNQTEVFGSTAKERKGDERERERERGKDAARDFL